MPLRLSGSTGVSGIDGTAQAPAVQGTNPNAGIYYSGNNVIVSTSGNTALTVGPSGNVAISNSFSISGQYVTPYSGMMKNRIINGDFKIDQRFSGSANNNILGYQYVVDRWALTGSAAGKLRLQQNNTNGPGSVATREATGFSNYFGANVVSSNTVNSFDYWNLVQFIEGYNVADLNWGSSLASPVTLSFWVYTSVPGTHGGSLSSLNSGRTYPFTYSVSTANTWEQKTITVPGDTTGNWVSNNAIGMGVWFTSAGGIGSGYSAGAMNSWNNGGVYPSAANGAVNIVSNANGSFYLTGVQLEKGSQATAFDFRHYTTELQLCRRYYQGVASGTAGSGVPYIQGVTAGTFSFMHKFDTQMRISPTVTVSTSGYSTGLTDASTAAPFINADGFSIRIVIPSLSTWSTGYNWQASAELNVQN